MPVDEGAVDDIAATVTALYDDAELALLRAMTARLARGLDDADWRTRKLQEVGQLKTAVRAIVAGLNAQAPDAARRAMASAWRVGNASAIEDLAGLPRIPQRTPQAVQALAEAIVNELRPVHSAILPQATSAYRRTVAAAAGRKLTGVQSTRRAAQAAWAGFIDQGITGFVDRSGRRWRLHTYVEMAVRTATTRAIGVAVTDTATAAGLDNVYVTDRAQECVICRPWEHKILAIREPVRPPAVATVAAAEAAGLHHPNCRHDLAPYVPGVTRLAPGRPDPAGDLARQRQRYLERQLRFWRERQAGALSEQAARDAGTKVAGWNAALTQHLTATGLARKAHREYPGAGYAARPSRRADTARI